MRSNLTRRDFLTATGVTIAAASQTTAPLATSARAADAEATPSAKRLLKAVKLSMVHGNASLAETFQMLKRVGFDGIDIDRHADHDEVRKAKEKSGLIVHGVVGHDHWHKPLSDPSPAVRKAGHDSFVGSLRDCKAYGGSTALLVPGKVTKEVPYADAYKRSQDEIRKLLPIAAELEIVIAIENVWNDMLFSPLEMTHYIDEINSPWVGSYFDVGNCVKYGWPEHWILALGKRIKKIDIKEYSRQLMNTKGPGAGFGVKIGDPLGSCDWPAVMRALDAIGYHGWATAEVPGGGPEEFQDISVRMDRVLSTRAVAKD